MYEKKEEKTIYYNYIDKELYEKLYKDLYPKKNDNEVNIFLWFNLSRNNAR